MTCFKQICFLALAYGLELFNEAKLRSRNRLTVAPGEIQYRIGVPSFADRAIESSLSKIARLTGG